MRTVDISELEGQLSGYLQHVRNGEEIVVHDHDVPVARIVPCDPDSAWEAELVASGAMKMPVREMDWDQFFATGAGNVPHEIAVQAAIDAKGDR